MLGYEDDFFSASELAVKGVGITNPWPRKSFKGVLYNLYRVVIFSVATVYFVFELMVMKETIKDLFKFLGNIGMFATHFVGVSKFLILTTQRKKIQKIMDSLQSDKFKYVSLGNFKPYEKFNTAKKRSSKIVTVLMVCYVGVGVSAHISAVLNMLGHEYTENIDCQMFVPYFSYWPYDFNTTFKCHILFFLFDWPLGIFASNIAAFDSLFGSLANCLQCQLEIVGGAFQTIRERTYFKMKLPKDVTHFKDEEHPLLEEEMYLEMKHCTLHLQTLIEAHGNIEALFTYVILAQSIISLIVFATCLYIASTVPLLSPEFFSQLEYFTAVLFQFSTFSWYGSEVIFAGHSVGNSIYNSDWTAASHRFKVAMIMNIRRSQESIYFSIGKFTPLTVATFVSVVRGSFSYFTVFKSVE